MTANLAQLLAARAESVPRSNFGVEGDQLTLDEALQHSIAFAQRISETVGADDGPLAIVGSSTTDYLLSWFSCQLLGKPVALINPDYPDEFISDMLERLSPSAVLVDDTSRSLGPAYPRVDLNSVRHERSGDLDRLPGLGRDPLDYSTYMHTSGTSGLPKFCAQSHAYFIRLGHVVQEGLALTRDDVVFAPLPLFHVNPLGYGVVGGLTVGASVLNSGRFSASRFWDTVKSNGVTSVVLHEPPVRILKEATKPADAAGHRIHSMFYADAAFMRDFGVGRAMSVYGSTEAGGISHVKVWTDDRSMPKDAGRVGGQPRSDIEWRLTAEGEIEIRELEPGAIFSGYATASGVDSARDVNGWFATGDLGRRSEDGDLVFIERAAEAIRVKGEYVPIQHVEALLSEALPDGSAALWKRPSDFVDDEVVAFIDSKEIDRGTLSEVISALPRFMRPQAVVRIASIPRDNTAGKVRRRMLKDAAVLESWETGL